MIWVLIVVAVVVIGIGALGPALAGRNKRAEGDGAAIAARDKYELLGHYVEDPAATDNADAADLLRKARERWNSAGAILAYARSRDDYQLAERVAAEGLGDVAAAHAELGIPGPPV
jgi:hypothetical protein